MNYLLTDSPGTFLESRSMIRRGECENHTSTESTVTQHRVSLSWSEMFEVSNKDNGPTESNSYLLIREVLEVR